MMSKYHTDEETRIKVDNLLRKIAKVECNLGADSTKQEFTKAKSKQAEYLHKIKERDEEFYNVLEP